jgi:glyoxylase-like metal-dependent hydrolase (beta-lactamase superfamily II)
MTGVPLVEGHHDAATGSISYIVADPASRHAALIDPVLGFDAKSGRTDSTPADALIAAVRGRGLAVDRILETHAHADHLSAAHYLKQQLGGRIAIGAQICTVQQTFRALYNLGPVLRADGSQFDHLFADGERFAIGTLEASALAVPGHTPADVAYQIGDAVFTGDTLFMPDVGTARADFPGGDAATLYRSIRRLLALRPETRLFVCHDYPPPGRGPAWQTTVAEQRARNLHVHDGVDEAAFVAMREQRDATLEVPNLILPALQVNIRAGALPPPEANGIRYLKIPLNALD